MLTVVTFKWASSTYRIKYGEPMVNLLEALVRRHYVGAVRFVCITDDPTGVNGETFPLWGDCGDLANACGGHLPSCYRRLKLFDPETQAALGLRRGGRLVSIDLDMLPCGPLNPLWDRKESFVGWAVAGSSHARVFNGSMWLLRAGAHAKVWRDFDPATSPQEAKAAGYRGSDQAWMSFRLRGAAGWTEADGVYSYPLSLKRAEALPAGARVVVFHGSQKPWSAGLPAWVAEHYRMSGAGRCLILGYGADVWKQAAQALRRRRFDGVIASPEAAEMWPGPITAIARCDDEAESLARFYGFDEAVFCGRTVWA